MFIEKEGAVHLAKGMGRVEAREADVIQSNDRFLNPARKEQQKREHGGVECESSVVFLDFLYSAR